MNVIRKVTALKIGDRIENFNFPKTDVNVPGKIISIENLSENLVYVTCQMRHDGASFNEVAGAEYLKDDLVEVAIYSHPV